MKKERMKMVKVNKLGYYDEIAFRNENYELRFVYGQITFYEKDADMQFLKIDTRHIEEFHVKNILKQYGFDYRTDCKVLPDEIIFLNFFRGLNVGIIKTSKGKNLYVGLLDNGLYSKEFLEEKYKVIINF